VRHPLAVLVPHRAAPLDGDPIEGVEQRLQRRSLPRTEPLPVAGDAVVRGQRPHPHPVAQQQRVGRPAAEVAEEPVPFFKALRRQFLALPLLPHRAQVQTADIIGLQIDEAL
jgi:hypothetical protein